MRTSTLRRSMLLAVLSCSVAGAAAPAADDPIQKAIKKGAKYLQLLHKPDPNYNGGSHGMGSAALAGLALLEAGVPENDPSIRNITKFIRERALLQSSTYEISLTIMFLDTLGNKADRPIIQMLGLQLMTGQGQTGGWSYQCSNALSEAEASRLLKIFSNESKLVSGAPKNDPAKKTAPKVEARPDLPPPETANDPAKKGAPAAQPTEEKVALHPEVAKVLNKLINDGNRNGGRGIEGFAGGDNSNTQFATLGLWCARKHGVPCDKSLAALDTRFRTSQDAGGGWGYMYQARGGGFGSSPAMTCAGLIALAVAKGSTLNVLKNKPDGAKPDVKDVFGQDPVVKLGLKRLGNYLTEAKGGPPEGLINRAKPRRRFKIDNLNSNLYFLWSLERVAVIYGLETIGNHDWYTWGADVLVDTQQPEGSWVIGGYPGATEEISTCFALLFLSRANVARDLSAALKGKVKDPGVSVLRGGGDIAKVLPERSDPKTEPMRDPAAIVNPMPSSPPAPPDFDAEAAKLANTVITATSEARPAILAQLRDSKGSVNTEGLARATSKLTGDAQQQTQDALSKRLKRMTAATLREMLKDDNSEIRRAAAIACALKNDKQFIPDLIDKLSDSESSVTLAARSSLAAISGKDFGPKADATPVDRANAISAWKVWWNSQK